MRAFEMWSWNGVELHLIIKVFLSQSNDIGQEQNGTTHQPTVELRRRTKSEAIWIKDKSFSSNHLDRNARTCRCAKIKRKKLLPWYMNTQINYEMRDRRDENEPCLHMWM